MKKCIITLAVVTFCSLGYGDVTDDLYTKCYEQALEDVSQGNLKAARDNFERALGFKPDDADAQNGLEMIEERLRQDVVKPAPVTATPDASLNKLSIRASLGSAPGWSESDHGASSYDMDDDTGGQLEVLVVQRFWSKNHPAFGAVLGAGVFFAGNSGEETEGTLWEYDTAAIGIMGQGGVAVKIGEYIILEALPYLGAGGAVTEVTFANGADDDGGGNYFMYGIKGSAFFKLSESIELGVEIGYQDIYADIDFDNAPDVELTGDDVRGTVVLSIKF